MKGQTENRDGARRGANGGTRTETVGRSRVRIRKSPGRRLRDLPELDLRTPSGRLLPY